MISDQGLPDLNYFPVKIWNRLSREQMEKIRPADLSYQSPEGRTELREAIAEYLNTERGDFLQGGADCNNCRNNPGHRNHYTAFNR